MLALALAVDLAWGEPPNAWHPVAWLGRGIAQLERLASRMSDRRQPVRQLLLGGTIVLITTAAATLPAWLVLRTLSRLPWPLRWLLGALALKPLFAVRALFAAIRQVEAPLAAGDLTGARLAASALVSRDVAHLDEPLLAAAAIESLAENLSDSVVAPVLAYLLGGLPLTALYRAANTLDAMLGYRDQREYLGKIAAKLDDALNLVPARLTALLLALAAPLVGRSPLTVFWVARRERRRTVSPNAGWPMAAAAVALDRCLEKRAHYRLHPAAPEPRAADIARARRLAAGALVLGALALLRRASSLARSR